MTAAVDTSNGVRYPPPIPDGTRPMCRTRRLLLLACGLALAPVGCFWLPRPAPPPAVVRLSPAVGEPNAGPEVAFDTRLVEQPFADDYLDRGLWTELSDPLPHHLTALLAANGLRVGVIAGTPSAEFERLATGEGTAVSPTLRRTAAGKPKAIPVNGPLDQCTAEVTPALTEDARTLDLKAVECGVIATGTPTPAGKVTVRCQFHLQHGGKRAWWTPTADGGFDRTEGRTPEAFPTLTFEVDLDPADTLVVGPSRSTDDTLGAAYFHSADGVKQRVLVIRAAAASAER